MFWLFAFVFTVIGFAGFFAFMDWRARKKAGEKSPWGDVL